MIPTPIAAGICPQGFIAGQRAPSTPNCIVINGGVGIWIITVNHPLAVAGQSILVPGPGSGSNLAPGVSFGQSGQVGNAFSFEAYRIDTGVPFDIEAQFVVLAWPALPVSQYAPPT